MRPNKHKIILDLIDGMLQGAYKCNECHTYGFLQVIPAVIAGKVEKLDQICTDGLTCIPCKSSNVSLIFSTKDDAEAQVYYRTMEAFKND